MSKGLAHTVLQFVWQHPWPGFEADRRPSSARAPRSRDERHEVEPSTAKVDFSFVLARVHKNCSYALLVLARDLAPTSEDKACAWTEEESQFVSDSSGNDTLTRFFAERCLLRRKTINQRSGYTFRWLGDGESRWFGRMTARDFSAPLEHYMSEESDGGSHLDFKPHPEELGPPCPTCNGRGLVDKNQEGTECCMRLPCIVSHIPWHSALLLRFEVWYLVDVSCSICRLCTSFCCLSTATATPVLKFAFACVFACASPFICVRTSVCACVHVCVRAYMRVCVCTCWLLRCHSTHSCQW